MAKTVKNDETAELKAKIKALQSENKALKNTAFSEDKKEGVILQMIDVERKPLNLFVTHNTNIPGAPQFSVMNNKENAHIFDMAEAKNFIKKPGQDHFIIVEL